ncbi:hypothetical protein, partial [Providencia alcalifaciens]|uniref:hypothetical protein n=1 Tax=Providencia alcalifaciens TaxID=126385 RepID=UPI002B05C392
IALLLVMRDLVSFSLSVKNDLFIHHHIKRWVCQGWPINSMNVSERFALPISLNKPNKDIIFNEKE